MTSAFTIGDHMTQRSLLFLLLSLCGCRYLGPVAPQVSPERPALLSGGNSSDPTRQSANPGRACVVDCGPGHHCDEKSAQCVADDLPSSSDAGLRWLP